MPSPDLEPRHLPLAAPSSPRGITGLLALLLLTAPPASAGPPFRTDDPEPVDLGHYEIIFLSLGTQTTSGWTGALPATEINYGALPNLQLHTMIGNDATAPTGHRLGFGASDLELGAKYRFLTPDDDDWFPQLAVYPQFELPTGNQRLGFNTGHTQLFLPIWVQKDIGKWSAYGGAGYWINPGAGNRNYVFYGTALWRKLADDLSVGVEIFGQTSSASGVKDSNGFNLGTTYDFSDTWHLLASVGTGLRNQTGTNQLSYYLAAQLTF